MPFSVLDSYRKTFLQPYFEARRTDIQTSSSVSRRSRPTRRLSHMVSYSPLCPFESSKILRSLLSTLITDGNLPVFPPEFKTLLRVSSKGQKHEPARVRSGFEPHLPASSHPSPPGEPRSSHVNYPGFPSSVVKEGKNEAGNILNRAAPSLPSLLRQTLLSPRLRSDFAFSRERFFLGLR